VTKTAFLFPGQGAQAIGMGGALVGRLPVAQSLFDRASSILGYDLLALCLEGPAEKLNSTVYSQPALFVCSLAALTGLKESAPELVSSCSATAGLSLGEYTALVFADAIDFDAGLRLVQLRGRAMQEASDAVPSGMVSVLGLDQQQVQAVCDQALKDGTMKDGEELKDGGEGNEILQIANLLCPGNITIAGHLAACQRVGPLAGQAGAMRVIPLPVAGAFHTPLMQAAACKLADALSRTKISTPRIPVISNVDARPHHDPEEIRTLLLRQLVNPVQWERSMRWLIDDQGVGQCYEIGPGRVLRGLLKRIARKLPCESISA
jgi:[acyl-carrier-protein] S-malonyltransferase